MSSEIGFIRRMSQTAPLLMSLILTATACTTGSAPTEASGPTTTQQAAVDTPTTDAVGTPEPSSGDQPIDLEWTEADLSGTTFIDQLLVTNRGFIVYGLYEDPQAWLSENGISWTEADLDFGTADEVQLSDITAGVPGYLALESTSDTDQVLWTSKDWPTPLTSGQTQKRSLPRSTTICPTSCGWGDSPKGSEAGRAVILEAAMIKSDKPQRGTPFQDCSFLWGRRVAEPVMWPQVADSDRLRTSRPDNAVPRSRD